MTQDQKLDHRALLTAGRRRMQSPRWARQRSQKRENFSRLCAALVTDVLNMSPATSTSLGVTKATRAPLKYMLAAISRASDARWLTQLASIKKHLSTYNSATLSAAEKVQRDAVMVSINRHLETNAFKVDRPSSGFFGNSRPFPVSQQNDAISAMVVGTEGVLLGLLSTLIHGNIARSCKR